MKYVSRMDIVQDMYTWMGCIAQWRKHLRNLEVRILQKKSTSDASQYCSQCIDWLHCYIAKTRHLVSISTLILPSDILFGDDLYCICLDHSNRETAMLSKT